MQTIHKFVIFLLYSFMCQANCLDGNVAGPLSPLDCSVLRNVRTYSMTATIESPGRAGYIYIYWARGVHAQGMQDMKMTFSFTTICVIILEWRYEQIKRGHLLGFQK